MKIHERLDMLSLRRCGDVVGDARRLVKSRGFDRDDQHAEDRPVREDAPPRSAQQGAARPSPGLRGRRRGESR